MSVTLQKEEIPAWDAYATSVLAVLVRSGSESVGSHAEVAAVAADEMIKQRRERIAAPKTLPSLNLNNV